MPTKADLIAAFTPPGPTALRVAGQDFHVRALTTGDMLAVQAYQKGQPDGDGSPMVFVRAVCDEAGHRLFEDGDAVLAAGMAGGIVDQVADEVIRISHLLRTPQGKAPSTNGPSSNSSSTSPAT